MFEEVEEVRPDAISFYNKGKHLLTVESSHAPDRGDLINIKKQTYQVIGKTYTIDYSEQPSATQIICVINMKISKIKESLY